MDQSNTRSYHLPSDAVWFITGCSSGIGQALAEFIATQTSNRLVATARNASALSYLPDRPDILKLALDVTSTQSVDAAVDAAVNYFGRLDVVVNNAGYGMSSDTEAVPDDTARRLVETDFWGTVRVTKHAMRVMREENVKNGQQGGVVMNVTSMGGFTGFPGNAFYHASKFAVEGFTESVAKEVNPDWNIHFAIIEPGAVQTNFAATILEKPAMHPAYASPSMPTRMIEAYVKNPKMQENWALPSVVAGCMYEVVSKGGKIRLRTPLGADAWGMAMLELEHLKKEFEEAKDIANKVSRPDQLEAIDFLKR
ncbi:hypothetical protein BP6252_07518 [Coleophoma cylindrospora]|uniref:Uncharacterized protein n=1 Tax=Coleophoma cylindrospora TaxID=1849047 RepID=A0A3D8RAA9_9HELO|nr:hypothetical protein BP6252_07518 [Coleophoma cylindrospora]